LFPATSPERDMAYFIYNPISNFLWGEVAGKKEESKPSKL